MMTVIIMMMMIDVSITQGTVGVVDKQSALARLDVTDHQLILCPTGWLTGDIIQQAQVLLQKGNSAIQGFQWPTLGPACNFNVVSYMLQNTKCFKISMSLTVSAFHTTFS